MTTHWPCARHHHDVVEDLGVDAPRRIDVGDRHQRRARRQLLDAAAVLNGRHGERVFRLHATDPARRPDDVGAFDVRLVGRQMTGRHRDIDRLHHDSALPVQHTEGVGEPQDVAKGLDVAVAATALAVADIGGAVHRSEIDHVATNVQMPFRSRACSTKLSGACADAPRRCHGRGAPAGCPRPPARRRGDTPRAPRCCESPVPPPPVPEGGHRMRSTCSAVRISSGGQGWSAAAAARARGRWSAQRALLHVGGTLRELQSWIAFARLGLSRRYCDLRDARCKLGEWTASTTSSSVPALPVACLRTGCRPAAATGSCCWRRGVRTGASGSGFRSATGVATTTRTSTGCTKPSRMPGWTARAASGRAAKSSAAPARSTPWSTCADSLRISTTGRPAPMPAGAGPACGRYSNPWKIAPTVAPGSCG